MLDAKLVNVNQRMGKFLPINVATREEHWDIVKLLLDNGARPDLTDTLGRSMGFIVGYIPEKINIPQDI
jgi:ankyrin repeat protein